MEKIGAYEAKTHLADLLNRVQAGEVFTITRYGTPIARLLPAEECDKESIQEAIKALKSFRKDRNLGDKSVKDLIEEGRRF